MKANSRHLRIPRAVFLLFFSATVIVLYADSVSHGQEIFQYLDATGKRKPILSNDVNDYLREVSGRAISAKDFRTWAGTLAAARPPPICTVRVSTASSSSVVMVR